MIALDTNILIDACDRSDRVKQQIAIDLLSTVRDGVLLWQVACEFVAASRKLSAYGFTPSDAWKRLAEFLDILHLLLPNSSVLGHAQELHVSQGVSFWDAMIYAACSDASLDTLYSEDLPALGAVTGLRVINPFATAATS